VVTTPAIELELVGGHPVLDLVNTVEGPSDGPPETDSLRDYGELAAWAAYAGVLDDSTAGRLAAAAREDPERAGAVLECVRQLRTVADDVFRAVATDREPAEAALAEVAAFGAEAASRARLVAAAGSGARGPARIVPAAAGFALAWDGDDLERVLWPLATATVDLLRGGPLDRVKTCSACCWLFIDTSRNRSRRWCTMNICGAQAKMRRYRARRATAGR
jgi:predicted RNA-binding Zn ribbon-like protein